MKPVNKYCILVDIRSFDVLCNDAISFKDALVKNDEARSVGEFFLVWIPLQLNLHTTLKITCHKDRWQGDYI